MSEASFFFRIQLLRAKRAKNVWKNLQPPPSILAKLRPDYLSSSRRGYNIYFQHFQGQTIYSKNVPATRLLRIKWLSPYNIAP